MEKIPSNFGEVDRSRRLRQTSPLKKGRRLATILVLHGPNLNLLGVREPELYGQRTLAEIDAELARAAAAAGHRVVSFQSNAEHELIDRLQRARDERVAWVIANPAALTHTSIALRDALLATDLPYIEVHLSNPLAREPFRHRSYFSDRAVGIVAGFGADSYRYALDAVLRRLALPGAVTA